MGAYEEQTNSTPVANAGQGQNLTLPHDHVPGGSASITLNGSSSSDPDTGDTLSYVWRQGATVVGSTEQVMLSRPAGIYTFTLSSVLPTPFVHTAFAKSTDKIEFIFLFNGQEYKDTGGTGLIDGVTAGVRTGTSGAFTDVTPTIATNKNTQIVVP